MARQDPAPWLRAALLLLWVPGCLALSGPRTVRGTVGGSLSVQCRYKEEFRGNEKYWCGRSCSILRRNKIVETTGPEREVRDGRVSIRDHPANLTFTVTMENLTEADGGTYWCGIDVPWRQGFVDDTFEVVVTVSPGEPHAPPLVPAPGCLKSLRREQRRQGSDQRPGANYDCECVCVRERESVCVCVCVCVEREKETVRKGHWRASWRSWHLCSVLKDGKVLVGEGEAERELSMQRGEREGETVLGRLAIPGEHFV
ncbi:CMRF35-like molecule 8 [Phyllostomus discolor]|uniref:CMRF35-like molecule 8 n=1 Tax=Phyllostomus discolor TaxID=89673 RepID=A0A7E6CD84_9CHIR|nr:CMRF35-like molecule 8 [Phyllostomus discolor]